MTTMLGIIGAGNMGSAILSRVRNRYRVLVCEKDTARAKFLRKNYKIATVDLVRLVKASDVILLAVKPQDFSEVLAGISPKVNEKKLVISIAAGKTTQSIESYLPPKTRVVRAMPNLPAVTGQGMTAICKGRLATARDLKTAKHIFDSVGKTVIIQEKFMDTVTAVSGSGPAYVFLFVECLTKAARSLGLDESLSDALIEQTLKGSLALLEQGRESAETLRARVTSKGGTTQAAMDVFMKNDMERIFKLALTAAKKRAGDLSRN